MSMLRSTHGLTGWTIAIAAITMISLNQQQPVLAQDGNATAIDVMAPWSRATPGGVNVGVAYLTLRTANKSGDRLIAVSSPRAGRAEIHTHTMDNGIMKMRRVEALNISPEVARVLAPGGDHIMLFDLKTPLKKGDELPLTLTFERAGQVSVSAEVAAIGAQDPEAKTSQGARSENRGSGSGGHDMRGSGAGGRNN